MFRDYDHLCVLPEKDSDLTGSGLVVGFANSSFEVLAGIGVFAALGFIAAAQGVEVSEVAKGGIGLAFFAFPTIINKAPFGEVLGVLFFGSLTFAALTSFISVIEVIISAVQDKLRIRRSKVTFIVGLPMMVVSVILFGTTTGLPMLDVFDKFVNYFGIVAVAFVSLIVIVANEKLGLLGNHLNQSSSFKVGFYGVYALSSPRVFLPLCYLVKVRRYLQKVMKVIQVGS